MTTTADLKHREGPGIQATIQRIGGSLAGMIMPNIAAFIAWGLITALFIPTGWWPNEELAALVGPIITVLLPVLIGYTGGRLVHGQRHVPKRRRVDSAVVLVGPGRVAEGPLDRGGNLSCGPGLRSSGQGAQPLGEFPLPRCQVLGEVVEHLGPGVRRGLAPAFRRLVRRLHGVPDVFPVPPPHRGDLATGRVEHRQGVAAVGTSLFAADVQFWRAVDWW